MRGLFRIRFRTFILIAMLVASMTLVACAGADGTAGSNGAPGKDGAAGPAGAGRRAAPRARARLQALHAPLRPATGCKTIR